MTEMAEMSEQISTEDRGTFDYGCLFQGPDGLSLEFTDIAIELAALRQRMHRRQCRLNHIALAGIPDQPLRPTLLKMERTRWKRNGTIPLGQQK
jgi:hypothetical protein